MFDVTAPKANEKLQKWHRDLRRVCGNIPIALYDNMDFEKPFLSLARELTGNADLHFVASPTLASPEVQIDMVAQAKHEAELLAAVAQPLPDEKQFLYHTGNADLHFVASPAPTPPEVQSDMVVQAKHEAELLAAVAQPLPDED